MSFSSLWYDQNLFSEVLTYIFYSFLVLLGILILKYLFRIFGEPRDSDILERWSALLTGRAESSSEFLDFIEHELETRDIPYKFSIEKLGFSQSNFVIVKFNRTYKAFIGYQKIGADLHITWSLWKRPSWFLYIPFLGWFFRRFWLGIVITDQNRMLAFASFTKDCTENVVDSIMDEHELDKTKLIRASSGKLGPL